MGVRAWELGVSGEWQRVRANLHALDRTHLRQRPSHASNARHTRSRINPHVIWQGARDKEGLLRSDGSMLSREGSLDLKRPRRSRLARSWRGRARGRAVAREEILHGRASVPPVMWIGGSSVQTTALLERAGPGAARSGGRSKMVLGGQWCSVSYVCRTRDRVSCVLRDGR